MSRLAAQTTPGGAGQAKPGTRQQLHARRPGATRRRRREARACPTARLVSAVRGRRGASGRDVGATAVLRADGGKRRGARRYGGARPAIGAGERGHLRPGAPGGAATGRLTMLGEMVVGERVDQAGCDWCQRNPNRPCPACNARRRRAVRLVEADGLSVAQAAGQMGLTVGRVERLLEEEADRRVLARLRQTHVENARLLQLFRRRCRSDPGLTFSELARRLGTSTIQVERWLGLRPTAAKIDRRGRVYPSRVLTSISVEVAGRLARAMGYAPCEIEGC